MNTKLELAMVAACMLGAMSVTTSAVELATETASGQTATAIFAGGCFWCL